MIVTRYAAVLRRLHWLMAVLLLLVFVAMEQRDIFPRGSQGRIVMMQSHYWIGLALFALVWWRLARRWKLGMPAITPLMPPWQSMSSKLLHYSLYALMMIMPLLGLATAWTDGKQLMLPFTDIAMPVLLAEDVELAHMLEDLHQLGGDIFYWVIGLHIVAALYHHFIRRDDTLRRMGWG